MRKYLLFGGIGRQQQSRCKDWIQRWKRSELNCSAINQELATKMIDDRFLLMKQSGQAEKVETMLGEIQITQHALATVMEKIQNSFNER